MWTKERHSKVLERVGHVCMMMRIIRKKEVGSNNVAERWNLKEAKPWEGGRVKTELIRDSALKEK